MKATLFVLTLVVMAGTALASELRAETPRASSDACTAASALKVEISDPALQAEISHVRQITAKYHDINWALVDGYTEFKGFEKDRGYRYQNEYASQKKFNPDRPSALMYVPVPGRGLHFAGVEYAVSADGRTSRPPQAFSTSADKWTLDEAAGEWRLAVWVGVENPEGIFAYANPCLQ